MSKMTKLTVSSPKQTADSKKQTVDIDAIAERTAEQGRQRKADSKKQTAEQGRQRKADSKKQTADSKKQTADSAKERTASFTECVKSVIDSFTERYDIVTDTCVDDYIRVNRHSSHKTYLQIYCKKQYVLFLISSASVDVKGDAFKHDKKSVERLSDQKCYARFKTSYDSAEAFLRALTDYDNRRQTAQQTSATERTDSAQSAQ